VIDQHARRRDVLEHATVEDGVQRLRRALRVRTARRLRQAHAAQNTLQHRQTVTWLLERLIDAGIPVNDGEQASISTRRSTCTTCILVE
jgi:hypothetical protein